VTSTLGPRKPWRKHKRSYRLFAVDMAGGVRDLATFGASGWVRKLCLQPLGDTGECPSQNTFCGLKTKLSFPPAVFGPPLKLVRSWMRVLVFKERKKEKALVHWNRVPPM
jgi:hypothetical protein